MSRGLRRSIVVAAVVAAVVPFGAGVVAAAETRAPGAVTASGRGPDARGHSDVGRSRADLARLPKARPGSSKAPSEGLLTTTTSTGSATSTPTADPRLQKSAAVGEAAGQEITGPLVSWAGQGGAEPPDPNGDVGPNHYVQMVNSTIQVWDKAGNSLAGPTNINQIWVNATTAGTGFDQCRTQNAGDPIVLYDQQVDRWMISQFTNPNSATGPGGTFPMCIAYSQTADPTQTWFVYQYDLPASHDYMKYGIWPDGLYMSTWEGGTAGAYVFDRSAMIGGGPSTFQAFTGNAAGGGVNGRGARYVPADWDGTTTPAPGAPNPFIVSHDGAFGGGNDRLELFEFHTDWSVPANSTFTLATTLNPAAFDTDLGCAPSLRECIPQPGTTQKIDALANRLMARLQYRNFGDHESMVINQTVDADGANRAGVRWYELRRTGGAWSIFQQGTYAPTDGVNRWMAAAAMDGKGNIAIGYSVSDGTSVFPGLRYTGRLAGDPLGAMTQGEQTLVTGTAANTSGFFRWGDYAGLTVDPVDDCTFWFTGERDARQTTIGSFRMPSCQGADVAVTKSDSPDPVYAGQDLTYTVTATNRGPATAQSVTITDPLPAGLQFLTAPGCTQAAGVVTCALGSLLPGQEAIRAIQVHVPSGFLGSATSTVVTNSATATLANQTDTDPANDTGTATTTIKALADLSVTKVCKPDSSAPAGTAAFCDIHVDNLGPSDAVGVQLTDVLTSATPFSVTGVTVDPSGTCAPTTGGPTTTFTTTCALGAEPAGGRSTIRVSATAADLAEVNDVATVTSPTPDPVTANNKATGTLVFSASADLALTKTGPATAVAGTGITYTLVVRNDGPSAATAVVLTDALPAGVSFTSVSTTAGTCTYGQPTARTLRCGLGTLASGATATVTVNASVAPDVAPGTILVNDADVTSATADPDNGDNLASVRTTVSALADLSVTKSDSPDPVTAGSLLTYTVTASNAGPSTASGVLVSDPLPAGTSFVSGVDDNGATVCALVQTSTVRCALGSLAPGASATVQITVRVAASVPDGPLSNTVTVSSSVTDPVTTNNAATETTAVQTRADLWLDKQATQRSGNPSPVVVYTLVVHNDQGCETDAQSTATPTCGNGGPSDARSVVVTDTLPLTSKKLVVQYVSPQCTYTRATHSVRCTSALVPAGASVTFVIEAQVSGSVGTILNTATASSATTDPVTTNNTNAASIVVKGGTGKK